MRGLLADANIEGHTAVLRKLLEDAGLWAILDDLRLELATFADLGFSRDIDDRSLWSACQAAGWVLFTDNRNDDGATSLHATLLELWKPGDIPVLTLASKRKFEHSASYRERVAADTAELLFGVFEGEYRDCDRLFVPR